MSKQHKELRRPVRAGPAPQPDAGSGPVDLARHPATDHSELLRPAAHHLREPVETGAARMTSKTDDRPAADRERCVPVDARDLMASYARDMAGAEPLSSADEVGLAKRIEAGQEAIMVALLSTPLGARIITSWAHQLRQGTRRVRDLVGLSTPVEDGAGAAVHDRPTLADRECELLADIVDRLERMGSLSEQLVYHQRGRSLAAVPGDALDASNAIDMEKRVRQIVIEIRQLGLRADRILDLETALKCEYQALLRVERGVERRSENAADATCGADLHRSAGQPAVDRTMLGKEAVGAVEQRVGLTARQLHAVMADIARHRRDIERAKEALVRSQLRLVIMIARKFQAQTTLHLLDLVQEGNLGLMRAVDKFDHRRGFRLSTYASWWIRQSITRAIADQGRTIRVPVHMTETVRRVAREKRRLHQELGRDPTDAELAERSHLAPHQVQRVQSIVAEPASLDAPAGEDGDATLGDLIAGGDVRDPHDVAEASELRRALAEALAELTPREQAILRLRFGIEDANDHTLQDVGERFGVTRERIRQIEAKALQKLRSPKLARKLSTFVTE